MPMPTVGGFDTQMARSITSIRRSTREQPVSQAYMECGLDTAMDRFLVTNLGCTPPLVAGYLESGAPLAGYQVLPAESAAGFDTEEPAVVAVDVAAAIAADAAGGSR